MDRTVFMCRHSGVACCRGRRLVYEEPPFRSQSTRSSEEAG
jgi:hypothetical protein